MTTALVLGGSRSGKSAHAEHLVSDLRHVTYIAPGSPVPHDREWAARIEAHRSRRPTAWSTVEAPDIAGVLDAAEPGSGVLVDDLGTWLTRLADDAQTWDDRRRALDVWNDATDDLLAAVTRCRAHAVFVTNETGLGVVPATSGGRLFRDAQGRLNARMADACDRVEWVVAGRVVDLSHTPRAGDGPTLAAARHTPDSDPGRAREQA